jgi:hypothetical protein
MSVFVSFFSLVLRACLLQRLHKGVCQFSSGWGLSPFPVSNSRRDLSGTGHSLVEIRIAREIAVHAFVFILTFWIRGMMISERIGRQSYDMTHMRDSFKFRNTRNC